MAYKESVSCSIAQTAEIAKVVLMPGDPLRAKYVAEHYLENPECFTSVRNMLGYTGTYKEKKISVMGSGMGIPSFALYATELFTQFDVDAIIRIGSTGGIAENVHMRDVVIAMGASSNSAFADAYDLPCRLAPIANYELLQAAVDSAKELAVHTVVGPVFSSDHFYNPDPACNQKLRDFGFLCVEMETAALYWVAQQYKKKGLSILTVSDHLFTGEMLTADERQNSFNDMMKVALETAWKSVDE